MSIKSLGLKVSLIVALMIAIIVAINVYFVSARSEEMVNDLTSKEAAAANRAFAKEVEQLQREAKTRAEIIAYSNDILNYMQTKNDPALQDALKHYAGEFDVATISDPSGNVLMRMTSDQKGDSVLNQKAVAAAINTGSGVGTIERGTLTGLSVRGSAVIRDFNGEMVGVIVCGNDLANPAYVDRLKDTNNCEATLFDGDTRASTTLYNESGQRAIGTRASDEVVDIVMRQRQDYSMRITLFGNEYYSHYSPLIYDNEVVGMLFTGINIDETLLSRQDMLNEVLLAGIICGVLCIGMVIIFSTFAVSRPLKKISGLAQRISSGDLGVTTSEMASLGVRSHDEVGAVAAALEQAFTKLRGYVGEIRDRMHYLAEGDLSSESKYDFQGDFILIKDSINEITRNLNDIMTEVNNSSMQVSSGAKQVADGSQMLAQGATEQAATVEELSASISDIAQKTKANAEMAEKAAKLAGSIKGNAEKGSNQMDEMIAAVKDINHSSQNISKIIKTIDDIAFQTNILALNAAVEAARAGQHGKGFAVVAEEVRNLASKSADAAKDTGAMIQDSMEKAEMGSRIAGETAVSLSDIVSGINESTMLISDIAKSSEEQSMGVSQVNIGIDQVAQVVQQNSATAQESAAASQEMSSQSDTLQQLIGQFKLAGNEAMRQKLPTSEKPWRKQLLMPGDNKAARQSINIPGEAARQPATPGDEKAARQSINIPGDYGKY